MLSNMRASPIDFHNTLKRPHYHVHHLRRRSLAVGNVPKGKLSMAPTSSGSAVPGNVEYNCKKIKEKFDMYLKSYCDMSSLHGFRYFAESGRPCYERCFWLFAICLVIVGMVLTIHSQIVNYVSNPILMTLNSKVTPVNDVPFPAITLCSDNQVRPSLMNISKMLEIYKERNLTIAELANLEIAKLLCADVNNKPVHLPVDGINLNRINSQGFLFAMKTCKKIFKRFTWQGKPVDNPCGLMQITSTFLGFCHSFNMIPPLSLYSPSYIEDFTGSQPMGVMSQYPYEFIRKYSSWTPDTGYVIDTNRTGYDVVLPYKIPSGSYINSANFILDFGGNDIQEHCVPRSNGFLVIVHSPNELPSLEHTLTYAELDARTVVHITPQLTNTDEGLRSWLPEERGCYYNHERQLKFFAIYTTQNCNLECEANYTLKICNCSTFFQPHVYSTPLCSLDKYNCYHRSTVISSSDSGNRGALYSACNCLPACNEIKYDAQVTVQPRNWTYNTYVHYGILENETERNNYANVLALFRYKQVNSIVRVAIVSDSDFIANIGGLMGLFLGFSFISVFEILYFCTIRWMTDVHKMRKCYREWNKLSNKNNKTMLTAVTKIPVAVAASGETNTHWQTSFIKNDNNSNSNARSYWTLPSVNENVEKNAYDLSKSLQYPQQLKVDDYYYD